MVKSSIANEHINGRMIVMSDIFSEYVVLECGCKMCLPVFVI